MNIIMADNIGFCMGVQKAIQIVYDVIEREKGKKISTFGPIIHNPLVLKDLAAKGVKVLDNPAKAEGVVIIRAHGVHPKVQALLEKNASLVVDATCPRVIESQRRVKEAASQGAFIIIAGDREHGEVKGIAGYGELGAGKEGVVVIESEKEALGLEISASLKVLLISQTTFGSEEYKKICKIIFQKRPDAEIAKSICPATEKRQKSLALMAEKVNAIVVIGGKNSANTVQLYESAVRFCKKAWHIESAEQLPHKEEFSSVQTIGITAGASTPDWVIKEVANILKKY